MLHASSASSSEPTVRPAFAAFADGVKARVEARIAGLAREHTERAASAAPDVAVVVGALFDLASRGGKRVRPLLMTASHMACGGTREAACVVDAGAAIEILHAYLLIHDDWMDGDETRRGAPSVHSEFRERFGSRSVGDACAVLAGDYGQATAFEILARADAPPTRIAAAMREVSRMLADVVSGQVMDVRGAAETWAQVERMHLLKTSSYTTSTPLVLGAILAGAEGGVVEALREAGAPLGLAFQLTDDLLGTFGDTTRTGKPAGSDLRRGKRTSLIAELASDRDAQRLIPRVLGVDDAPEDEVAALVSRMVASGAKARVEARIAALGDQARARIERADLRPDGKALLLAAVDSIVRREA